LKKKGSWGSKKTQRDEVTDVKNIGSEIKTGGDLSLVSGGDQLYQGAKLNSGGDLTLDSGGSITFEAVKDSHQESHEKSSNNLAWMSMSGKGNTDETLRQSVLLAQGQVAIKAVDGLHIDVKQVNQQTVSQAIDAMVAADPQMAWLKDAEQRGDVDWQLIQEVHDSYEYSHSGLGQGAMLAIIIIVTVLTAGSGTAAALASSASAAAQTAALAAGMSAATAATIGAAAAAAATASFSAVLSQAAISGINNKGNLGATLKDVTSSESLKGYVVSGLVAGFAAGVLDKAFGVTAEGAGKATHGFALGELDGFTKYAGYTLAENGFAASANAALNGGSLKDALAQAAIGSVAGALSASLYNKLGTQLEFSGLPAKVAAHALVGG
jgi:filamentous hemagglutinin